MLENSWENLIIQQDVHFSVFTFTIDEANLANWVRFKLLRKTEISASAVPTNNFCYKASSMIHSAKPIVTPVANVVFCFVFLDLKSGDWRTGHVRKQWSLPAVTLGWPSGSTVNCFLYRFWCSFLNNTDDRLILNTNNGIVTFYVFFRCR